MRLTVDGQMPLDGLSGPVEASWAALGVPGRSSYLKAWRAFTGACITAGLHPRDLAADPGSVDRLAVQRGWKPGTVTLYVKIARYCGIPLPSPATPEPARVGIPLWPLTSAAVLAGAGLPGWSDPVTARTLLWLTLARSWPAGISEWTHLQVDQLVGDGNTLELHRLGRPPIPLPDPDHLWTAWRATVQSHPDPRVAHSLWALPTLGSGRTSRAGDPLSERGLQAAFKRHANTVAYALDVTGLPTGARPIYYSRLTFDTYRRGCTHAIPNTRGVVRRLREAA